MDRKELAELLKKNDDPYVSRGYVLEKLDWKVDLLSEEVKQAEYKLLYDKIKGMDYKLSRKEIIKMLEGGE